MSEKKIVDHLKALIAEAKKCRDTERLWIIARSLERLGDCEAAAVVEAKRWSLMRDWSAVNR